MQPPSELVILAAVADEARLILHRLHRPDKRRQVGDEILRHTAATQELLGDFPLGFVECVDADSAGRPLVHGFQTLGMRKVNVSEDRGPHFRIFKADLSQLGLAQVDPVQEGTGQVGPAQVGLAQVGPAQVGPAQVGPAQVGPAQVGPDQVGPAQVGPAQVGPDQVGPAQVGPDQIESRLRVHLPPFSDGDRASLDDRNMLWIGHNELSET